MHTASPPLPCPRSQTAGPLPALRAATRDHHDRIDRLMDLRRLRDRARYGRMLQAFDAFLAGWEPAVAAALPVRWGEWLRARSRRPFLQQDLRVLHLPALADAVPIAPLATAAAAWGSVYVMEGSALGAQVITRHLAEAGVHSRSGAAYFYGWGDATGAMWREFRLLLDAQVADPGAIADACAGARRTFETLTRTLEDALHERLAAA